ncbi:MAG TPA: hypothetical protein V6D12_06770 [Candidatus Obscuribacterales bacterium]
MKVWLASFLLLFAIAELYQWMKHFTLPLPVYILGGAFLAIASNYERRASFPFARADEQSTVIPNPTPGTPVMPLANPPSSSPISQYPSAPQPQQSHPISFTIRRKEEPSGSS